MTGLSGMTGLTLTDVYDELYARRDPEAEVARIHPLLASTGGGPGRLLDIGCGTGRHAPAWCARGIRVTGVDTDTAAIATAKARAAALSPRPEYHAGTVADLPADGFDAATALFHVVNYLPDVVALVETLRAVRSRLVDGAPFVFDAWNGIAALLDPPRVKDDEAVGAGGRRITVRTSPSLDRMAQTVTLVMQGTVVEPDGTARSFESRYEHRLWMPRELAEVAEFCGFRRPGIVPADGRTGPADETCWKILFTTTARAER